MAESWKFGMATSFYEFSFLIFAKEICTYYISRNILLSEARFSEKKKTLQNIY